MKEPLLSVIIPVYNVELYIEKCMETVLNQTYRNLEIILVDDGSTDNCGKICDRYAKLDSRVKCIHKKNGGLADARNEGLKSVHGKYLAYVDSDDYIEIDMFEKLLKLAVELDADIVACKYKEENNGQVAECLNTKHVSVMTGEDMLDWYILKNRTEGKITPSVWDRIYKTEVVKNIVFEAGKNYEDIVYSTEVFLCASKCVYYDEALYIYVQRSNSIMNEGNALKELLDEVYQLKKRIIVLQEARKNILVLKCQYDLFYVIVEKEIKYMDQQEPTIKGILLSYHNDLKKLRDKAIKYSINNKLGISKVIGINLAVFNFKLYTKLRNVI